MSHETVASFILFPPDIFWLNVLKIVFIVFSVILAGITIYLGIFKTRWIQVKFLADILAFINYKPYGARKATGQWMKILSRLEKGLESEYKLAVIEAHSMLEDALIKMHFQGETLADRLKQTPPELITNVQELESAHGIRNNIVRDPDYRLSLQEAKKAVDAFEKALLDLEIL